MLSRMHQLNGINGDGDGVEKVNQLQDAALLHTLATHPERILAPGKTLRSGLLSGTTELEADKSNLDKHVETQVASVMHKAFWDQATEALKNPLPSIHLPRLEAFYRDLASYIMELFPPNHPCLITFTAPLPPTPAALQTARGHLTQLTSALMTRCAPVRDEALQKVLAQLHDERTDTLPDRIVGAVKDLITIAQQMKQDLNRTMLGSVSDEKLAMEVLRHAREKERETLLKIWSRDVIHERWKAWLEDGTEGRSWTRRLVRALGKDIEVSCPQLHSSEDSQNTLPPVFFFTLFDLVHLQNYIQAVVIAAILRTLVPLRPSNISTPHNADASQPQPTDSNDDDLANRTFTDRILSLLSSEVEDITSNPLLPTQTKLAHLADEVDRELRSQCHPSLSSPSTVNGEVTLTSQDKVTKLLDPTNPVFKLLRKRLLDALADGMDRVFESYRQQTEMLTNRTRVPATMMTGRARDRKRPRIQPLVVDVVEASNTTQPKEIGALRHFLMEKIENGWVKFEAKGFEDPVLRKGVEKAAGDLANCIEWVRDVWRGTGLELAGIDDVEDLDEGEEASDDSDNGRRAKNPLSSAA